MRFGLLLLDLADFNGVQTGPRFGEAQGRHHNFSKLLEIKDYEVFREDSAFL